MNDALDWEDETHWFYTLPLDEFMQYVNHVDDPDLRERLIAARDSYRAKLQ